MNNLGKFEAYYRNTMQNLPHCIPEGIIEVDLALLQHHDLIDFEETEPREDLLTRYFHVLESEEKITLISDQFVIWIVPESTERSNSTLTIIALNCESGPKLELAFSVSGVYNTSKLVLRILEKFLHDIQETEDEISRLKKAS